MRKLLTSIFLFSITLSPSLSYGSEQAELDQAIRQLESAKKALERAKVSANATKVKQRIYFDYIKAYQDIDLIKTGIDRYINSNRAQPRDPRQIRALLGEYDKVKEGYK